MPDDLILYTNPMSRGRIARWALEETEVPYRTEILDYGTTMKAPAYLAINPMGKVPALVHNGTSFVNGDAIVRPAFHCDDAHAVPGSVAWRPSTRTAPG